IAVPMFPTSGVARRVLLVGGADTGEAIARARSVPVGGLLICIDGDRARAARTTAAFVAEGLSDRAHVMVGDPALFIGKVAGPFDLVVVLTDAATTARLQPHFSRLLAPGGRVDVAGPA